jgi:hypothetical protein
VLDDDRSVAAQTTSVAVIGPDPKASRGLYIDTLGLPLTAEGNGYLHSESIEGCTSSGSGR